MHARIAHLMTELNKPYSQACENNKQPILSIITPLLVNAKAVLEIGSGTGQHAVYFAQNLPHLIWYTSDLPQHHNGIKSWLEETKLPNLQPPLALDVSRTQWPAIDIDAVFSANTAHIMHWHEVECLFAGVGDLLPDGGRFLLYGPFNYNNQYTSDSNRRFDAWLKADDPGKGIRNFEDLDSLALQAGMKLEADSPMPANNRILCWYRSLSPTDNHQPKEELL